VKKFFVVTFLLMFLISGCRSSDTARNSGSTDVGNGEDIVAVLSSKGRQSIEKGVSWRSVITEPDGTVETFQVWHQGMKSRMEAVVKGQRVVTIVDGASGICLIYFPEKNLAIKYVVSASPEPEETPASYLKWKGEEFEGEEMIDGVKCAIIRSDEATYWVREDNGVPMRVKLVGSNGKEKICEFKDIKVGSISPDTFLLPPGVKVVEKK